MKRSFKQLLTFLLLAAIVFTLASCGDNTPAETPSTPSAPETPGETPAPGQPSKYNRPDEVVIGLQVEIGDISPFGASQSGKHVVKHNFYETLFVFNGFGQPYDEMDKTLAKDIEIVDDFTMNIEIYDYIKDSAGNPITAEDVVFSYEEMAASGFYNTVASNLGSIKALDEYTVELVLSSDAVGMREYMLSYVPIVSKKGYEEGSENYTVKPIATGPYVVADHVAGSHLTFEVNENYWQTDESLRSYTAKQPAKKITFQVIKEASQMSIALETGTIDLAAAVTPNEVERFMDENGNAKEGYIINDLYGGQATFLHFNCDPSSVASNKTLREAICYAIDAQGVVDAVLRGHGTTIGTTATGAAGDYNPAWEEDYFNYDLDKAKALLKEAGYEPGELTLRLLTNNETDHKASAEIVQAYLSQIGVNVDISTLDDSLYSTYRNDPSEFDITIHKAGSSGSVINCWDLLYNNKGTKHGGAATIFVKDAKLQELLENCSSVSTYTPESVDAFADYVKEQAYGMGLFMKPNYSVGNERVVEIVRHPFHQVIGSASVYDLTK